MTATHARDLECCCPLVGSFSSTGAGGTAGATGRGDGSLVVGRDTGAASGEFEDTPQTERLLKICVYALRSELATWLARVTRHPDPTVDISDVQFEGQVPGD